jgi:Baseplate J-like protein
VALTLPNLDDRTFADLMEEARGLIVANAPALTNHNPTDPLITISEMFAYLTEVLLFRMNVVTDANREQFLRLLNGPPPANPPPPDPSVPPVPLDERVRQTVLNLRQTDRAVTPADFEFLAHAADSQGRLARAHCVPGFNLEIDDPVARFQAQPADVSVLLVPFEPADLDALITDVRAHLEPRRLITTKVRVRGPRSVPIRVQLKVTLLPDAKKEDVRPRVADTLAAWFDPITGGREGEGWPFGRTAYVSEIYQLLDGLAGVDFVSRRVSGGTQLDELTTTDDPTHRVRRNDAGELIGIALKPDELVALEAIALADIEIVEPST